MKTEAEIKVTLPHNAGVAWTHWEVEKAGVGVFPETSEGTGLADSLLSDRESLQLWRDAFLLL